MSTKILIIDDDENFVLTLQMEFELDGYTVETATRPSLGLEKLKQFNPDIILLDWEMLEINGIELVKQIKADIKYRTCYVIMITGRTGTKNIVLALDAGADDFLHKPFEIAELKARIRSGLRIRELEKQIASDTKSSTVLEMALTVADKIGNPLVAAKLYQRTLIQNPAIKNSKELNEAVITLGTLLDEGLELLNKYQLLKTPRSIQAAGNKKMIAPE